MAAQGAKWTEGIREDSTWKPPSIQDNIRYIHTHLNKNDRVLQDKSYGQREPLDQLRRPGSFNNHVERIRHRSAVARTGKLCSRRAYDTFYLFQNLRAAKRINGLADHGSRGM